MRKALLRITDGFVKNIIEIDEQSTWQPPEGYHLIDAGNASPGDTWNGEEFIKPEPEPSEPPCSTYLSVLEAIDTGQARPARIKRTWEGKDYFYDCLITQSVKDQYVAGNIAVGDYVLVHFDDIGEHIVTAKVFKSWQD